MSSPWFGVDLVDVQNPRTRARHLDARFMRRIFGEREASLIRESGDPERAVWRHWAAKEGAFKALSGRRHPAPPPTFRHSDFEVVALSRDEGELRYHDHHFSFVVREDPAEGWVACLVALADAVSPEITWCVSGVEKVSSRLGLTDASGLADAPRVFARLGPREARDARGVPHALVRLAARSDLARALGVDAERLEIVNAPGRSGFTPPRVHLDGVETERARLSLSHDGPHLAWAIGVGG